MDHVGIFKIYFTFGVMEIMAIIMAIMDIKIENHDKILSSFNQVLV